jgi:hypothetical protein
MAWITEHGVMDADKYAGLLLQDLRGLVVQQGGSWQLSAIPMALDGTDKGTWCEGC